MLKLTSNAIVTLVKTEQDCFKELFEVVDITRRISVITQIVETNTFHK